MTEANTIEYVTPEAFHDTDGAEDWRVLADGAATFFRTGSFSAGARLVNAISELDGRTNRRPDVDLRHDGVTVRLTTVAAAPNGLTTADVKLARRISAAAHALDVPADPSAVQTIQISIQALAVGEVMPFWSALLGYERRPGSQQRLINPRARDVALVFEHMDAPRPLRNRIHFDLATPYDIADARREAALAHGGQVVDEARSWVIADAEGNEVCAGGADPGVVPREPSQWEGWEATMAEGSAGPLEVGWRQFHETDGAQDWRMLEMGAATHYRTGTFAAGARFVEAISGLDGLGSRRPDIDLRSDGVTLRLVTLTPTFGGPASQHDVELAREISAIARELELPADPTATQSLLISIDALDIPASMRFWSAALGYHKRQDTDEDLLDPHARWSTVWFQQMDAPRPQRNRIHLEVFVPHDQAEARMAAVLAAGGRLVNDEHPSRRVLADPEDNEVHIIGIGKH